MTEYKPIKSTPAAERNFYSGKVVKPSHPKICLPRRYDAASDGPGSMEGLSLAQARPTLENKRRIS